MQPQSLLFVFAHPDDEVSFAGTAIECLRQKHKVTFVCATNGQGRIPEGKSQHFRKEQMKMAMHQLGVDSLIFLDWEDGQLATEYDLKKMEEKISNIIETTEPNIIATFPPDGITRHPDHLAIHHTTRQAFYKMIDSRKNQELYYWCRGNENFYQTLLRPTPQAVLARHRWELESITPTIKLDVRHHHSQKLKALYCHEGQRLIHYLRGLSENDREDFLGYEYFYPAFFRWPFDKYMPKAYICMP